MIVEGYTDMSLHEMMVMKVWKGRGRHQLFKAHNRKFVDSLGSYTMWGLHDKAFQQSTILLLAYNNIV